MNSFAQDFRFALRLVRKSPGFALIAIVTLALGVGANTAIFSVLDAVLLREMPYSDPDRVTILWETHPSFGQFLADRTPVRLSNYFAWKERSRSFVDMAVLQSGQFNLTGGDKPEHLDAGLVSTNFFGMLGVIPLQARTFAPQEGEPGNNRVVVLSEALFERRFGREARIIGSSITLDRGQYTVIGVLPARFHLPAFWQGMDHKKPDLWVALNTSPNQPKDALNTTANFIFARLRPGVTLQQARAEMKVIGARMVEQHPELDPASSVSVFPLRVEDVSPALHRNVLILQFAVGFVLLIACANIANLLLTRAAGRERELAVRIALGAGRGMILFQMLAESVVLSLAGGLAGLALAYGGIRLIAALAPADVHNLHELRLDPRVLAYAMAVVVFTSVMFALAPALHATAQNLHKSLSAGGRGGIGGRSRMKAGIVVAEVALACILLISAGLMVRSLAALMAVNPGFRSTGVLTMHLSLPATGYPQPEQVAAFSAKLERALQQLPGVEAVAMTNSLPLQDLTIAPFRIEGAPPLPRDVRLTSDWQAVTANYFTAMGTRIERGRAFSAQEIEQKESGVAIVNESFARQYLAGQDPLGKALIVSNRDHTKSRLAVIGVAADTRTVGLENPSRPEFYRPSREFRDITLIVRSPGNAAAPAPAVLRQVTALDKDLPVTNVQTMDEILRESSSLRRFEMILLLVFGAIALVLACVGLYGVLAYSVAQRTREMGVRVALGAEAGDVLRLVVRQGLVLALIGVTMGLAGAYALMRLMSSVIFGVTATDPVTFLAVAAGLIGVALVASYVPARRASRVDPIEALRAE